MNIFTSNPDFYPTPREVIERMLQDETVLGKIVLEPSAGKGDIVNYLHEQGASRILACENDPNIRKLLSTAPCEFLAEDFLTVTSEQVSHIDMIIMNPPFSKGVDHILHAYDIAPAGCTIIALCNSSNLNERSYYERTITKNERLKELITDFGYEECLGNCFSTAERQTECRVSLVKLWKDGVGTNEFDGYIFDQTDTDELEANQSEGLISYNIIREIVNRYKSAVSLFDETLAAAQRINDMASFKYTKTNEEGKEETIISCQSPVSFQPVKGIYASDSRVYENMTHAQYKCALKKAYWRSIIRVMDLEKYSTRELREQLNKFIERQVHVPFTMHNIYRMIDMIIQTNGQRMQRALVEVFDNICALSAQNSTAGEKWKTNANYMVNRRFIKDYVTDYDQRWPKSHAVPRYDSTSVIDDLVKALCWLTGRDYAKIPSLESVCSRLHPGFGEWFHWAFFRVRMYKKGTAHFEFLDEDVWARFNREVAKIRGWNLGSKEEKKTAKKSSRSNSKTSSEAASQPVIDDIDIDLD